MRRLSLSACLTLAALGLLLGCGDDDDNGGTAGSTNGGSSGSAGSTNGGSSGSTNGGSAGSVTAGTGGSSGSPGSDLSGHWTTSSPTEPKVDITLSATTLEILVGEDGLKVDGQPDGTFTIKLKSSGLYTAKATPQKAGEGLGFVPLPLAGDWAVGTATNEPGYGCKTSLVGAKLSASCLEVDSVPRWMEPSWTYMKSQNFSNGSVQGERVEEHTSSFGALSGRWKLTLSGGGSCDVLFKDTTFEATCQDATTFTGKLQVTIADDVASGSLSGGLEFAAMRH